MNEKLKELLEEDPGDKPAFYSDEEISGWMSQFNIQQADTFIMGCPFSFATIRREYFRRLSEAE